jgi:hypothetical protein
VGAVPPAVALASPQQAFNWTEQYPATSPPALYAPSMAYDAANGKAAVLFGGDTKSGNLVNNTWTWNGTAWTEQQPATSPGARWGGAIAYDAATGNVVLFGGAAPVQIYYITILDDTWTWG